MKIAELPVTRISDNSLATFMMPVYIVSKEREHPMFCLTFANDEGVIIDNPQEWAQVLKSVLDKKFAERPESISITENRLFYYTNEYIEWQRTNVFFAGFLYWDEDEGEELNASFRFCWSKVDNVELIDCYAEDVESERSFYLTREQAQTLVRFMQDASEIVADYMADPELRSIDQDFAHYMKQHHSRREQCRQKLVDKLVDKHANHYITQTIL